MIRGRVWLFGHDVNTDAMMPGDMLFATEAEQTRATFRDLRPGWADGVQPGDVIVAGRNFGAGSSRPAARSFVRLGIAGVIAESLSSLFFRSCVSYGLVAMSCPGVLGLFAEGDAALADPGTGHVSNAMSGAALHGISVPRELLATMRGGGILAALEDRGLISAPWSEGNDSWRSRSTSMLSSTRPPIHRESSGPTAPATAS